MLSDIIVICEVICFLFSQPEVIQLCFAMTRHFVCKLQDIGTLCVIILICLVNWTYIENLIDMASMYYFHMQMKKLNQFHIYPYTLINPIMSLSLANEMQKYPRHLDIILYVLKCLYISPLHLLSASLCTNLIINPTCQCSVVIQIKTLFHVFVMKRMCICI